MAVTTDITNTSLLIGKSRVEVPFITVKIGDYTFGVKSSNNNRINYPNYVKSLQITKVNGTLNKYKLELIYMIQPDSDPNYFEKVLSSVSKGRNIEFSYGDLSNSFNAFRNETAIITDVNSRVNLKGSSITYNIDAQSTALQITGYTINKVFSEPIQPSSEIVEMLNSNVGGILDIFYGMKSVLNNPTKLAELLRLDDKVVTVEPVENMNVLDYLKYLVDYMQPDMSSSQAIEQGDFYVLNVLDDTTGDYGGPYFKITRIDKAAKNSTSEFVIDVGTETKDIVLDFEIQESNSYSILYDYTNSLSDNGYRATINNDGEFEYVYAPIISSTNKDNESRAIDDNWWKRVTQYPIKCSLTIKGLLRPAILMTNVRLNVTFYGKKHISSGKYIITQQVDTVNENGYVTNLTLTKISGDN